MTATIFVFVFIISPLATGGGHASTSPPSTTPAFSTPLSADATSSMPRPLQVGAYSVDAILVFVESTTNDPYYSFRGHSPDFPVPVNTALTWNWFTGNPAAPDLATKSAALEATAGTKQARIAWSREGYAVAVWDSESSYGTTDCGFGPIPLVKSDIRYSVFDDRTGAWSAPATAAAAPQDGLNHHFIFPAIAIDNNGNGLLSFTHWMIDPCGVGTNTRELRYAAWTGATRTFAASSLLAVSAIPPGVLNVDQSAVAFSATLGAAGATTRQKGVVFWWDGVVESASCGGPPFPVPTFWPMYRDWDGNAFGGSSFVPGRRTPAQGRYESLVVRGGLSASSDGRGNITAAFSVRTTTDICTPGVSDEVWRGRRSVPGNSWDGAAMVDAGSTPSLAYRTETPGDSAYMVYQGPDPPPGQDPQIRRSRLSGTAISTEGQIATATGYFPAIAHLGHNQALAVWSDGTGALQSWQRTDGVPPIDAGPAAVGASGAVPFLAARAGSPQLPHAEWTYLQYMAHDDIPAGMTTAVLNRLESVGSSNLVNLAILLDEGANPTHTRDFYARRLARTELQDHGQVNMAAQATLRDFIARTIERYPARGESILVLEDHGRSWKGVCSDDNPTAGDWIDPTELRGALSAVNVDFDLLIFNACLMGNIETAYQVEGFAKYMVASQENMPVSTGTQGLRHDLYLDRLITDPLGVAANPLNFANSIVADYQTHNAGIRDYTLSSIHVESVPALVNVIAAFRNLVLPSIDPTNANFNANVRDALRGHAAPAQAIRGDSGVRDLFHFFALVQGDGTLAQNVRDAAQAVLNEEAVVVRAEWSEPGPKPNARGLNLWLESSRVTYNADRPEFVNTRFDGATLWRDVVRHLSQTRGVLLILDSSERRLFLRVRDVGGNEVGSYSADETCGGFCNSAIPTATCGKNATGMTIFLPSWMTRIDWFLDGALIGSFAPYTLTIQEVSPDPTTGDTRIGFSQAQAGSVAPAQVVTGSFTPDYAAPTTTAILAGTAGSHGWWRSPVTVTLNVADPGHGVAFTRYRVDGNTFLPYTVPFVVSGDSTHMVEYFSTDFVGNVQPTQSVPIPIDTTAPTVAAQYDCTLGNAGWCRSAATVTSTVSDETSGIASHEYRVSDGSQTPYTGAIILSSDGTIPIEIIALDLAGNSASLTTVVRIDATPPVVQLQAPALARVPLTTSRLQVTISAEDAVSGAAGCSLVVDAAPPVILGTERTFDITGLSDGPHIATATCEDVAGNAASSPLNFVVDTNPLSPTGPYGAFPLVGIGVGIVGVAGGILYLRWWRKKPGASEDEFRSYEDVRPPKGER